MKESGTRRRIPWEWIGMTGGLVGVLVAAKFLPAAGWVADFNAWIQSLGTAGIFLYVLVYVAVAVLLGPAWLLTIGAGFIFGLALGVAVVSVGATIGAAIAFLIARHLARRRVEGWARKNAKFGAIDRAIARKGWKIVFLLRLSPVVPYTISNYLYGLTAIRFVPYVLASWIGMIPLQILYAYFGVAGKAAVGGDRVRTPIEWAVLAAGLVATIGVAVLIARTARRELEGARSAEDGEAP